MRNNNRNKLLLIAAVLVLLALSCSDLTVENNTASAVRVVVTMPGVSVPETVLLSAGDSEFFVSDYSGSYTVTAVLDESWRDKLKAIRDELTLMLLGQFNELDQDEISKITRQLGRIESLLDAEMQPVSEGIMSEYTGRILAAFPDEKPTKSRQPQPAEAETIVEPLSEREIEVLALIAEGLTNREIAHRLAITLATVKTHTYNIYGKLVVKNRVQAVAKAQSLGILHKP